MSDQVPEDWTMKLAWMRENGVLSASWEELSLIAVTRDTSHQSPSTPTTTQQDEPKPDPKEVQRRTQLGAVPALVGSRADR